ncbi:hypothetical protein GCK32_005011 [Trichostrongylus colubriformis]|uniref:Uncharacterized protein n=1 Tax=Trichostrongylus colubriformis TaxID=6319 RepID=A0AAN8FFN6_TRICO
MDLEAYEELEEWVEDTIIKEEARENPPAAAVNFTEKETELIPERYAKRRMIQELTVDVNALGIARRSEKQVEQKIRHEIKILKKYGNAVIS